MKERTIWCGLGAFMVMGIISCSRSEKVTLTTSELQKDDSGTWTVVQLESKVKMLEKRVEEQEEFIKKAKEVLASHRAHILEHDNQLKVMTDARFQPKSNVQKTKANIAQ